MIKITKNIVLNESELKISFTRSSGPGGQNVNKVASAAQLRFNILLSSSLSEEVKNRLLALIHHKITQEGEFIIKADRYRTQERNKHDAIERLITLIRKAATPIKKRKKLTLSF